MSWPHERLRKRRRADSTRYCCRYNSDPSWHGLLFVATSASSTLTDHSDHIAIPDLRPMQLRHCHRLRLPLITRFMPTSAVWKIGYTHTRRLTFANQRRKEWSRCRLIHLGQINITMELDLFPLSSVKCFIDVHAPLLYRFSSRKNEPMVTLWRYRSSNIWLYAVCQMITFLASFISSKALTHTKP